MCIRDRNWESLVIPQVHGNCPFDETKGEAPFLRMNGQDVYKFAVTNMAADLKCVIEEAGLTCEQVDFVLPHQANIRIIEAAAHRLSIPREKYVVNIERYGNTSSASIPMMLDELNRQGTLKKGDILAMTAFGGGFTTCLLYTSGRQTERWCCAPSGELWSRKENAANSPTTRSSGYPAVRRCCPSIPRRISPWKICKENVRCVWRMSGT